MSEPNQLYARVRLSRGRLDEFLAGAFPDAGDDEAVLEWLSTAEYYGPRYTPDLIRERMDGDSTIAQWVEELMAPAPRGLVMPGRNAALDFSENYDDYGYLFEDGAVSVAMKIGKGAAALLDESDAESLFPEAGAVMEALVAEGAS